MKVAFDEDIPIAMVRVFQTFARENQFRKLVGSNPTIESAADYVPKAGDSDHKRKDDTPWIRRFAKAGGKVIITADSRMMSVPHERLALIQEGLVVVFFEKKWNNWKFWKKCALLLLWWPIIVSKLKKAKPGTFWRVPSVWDDSGKLRQLSNEDPKALRIERKLRRPKTKRAKPKEKPSKSVEVETNEPRFQFWPDEKAERAAQPKPKTIEGQQTNPSAKTATDG